MLGIRLGSKDFQKAAVINSPAVSFKIALPEHLARRVQDLYVNPLHKGIICSLSNAFTSAFKELRPDPAVQGDGQARGLPGGGTAVVTWQAERMEPESRGLSSSLCPAPASRGECRQPAYHPD